MLKKINHAAWELFHSTGWKYRCFQLVRPWYLKVSMSMTKCMEKKNWVMSHSMKDTFRKKHISNSKLLLQNVNVLWQSQVSLNTEWRRKAF